MTEVRVEEVSGVSAPEADPKACVLQFGGELDAGDTGWSVRATAALSDGCEHLVLDLRNVTFIDSSVVRELILLHRALPKGGWIHLVYTHHLLARVLEICGVADLFPQFTTVEAALRDSPTRHLDGVEDDAEAPHDAPSGHRVWTGPGTGTMTTSETPQWSSPDAPSSVRPSPTQPLGHKPGQRF